MAIDTSIYNNLRTFQMPSLADSADRAGRLQTMAMQQDQLKKQGASEDRVEKLAQYHQTVSVLGGAVNDLAGLPEPERARVWPGVRSQLVASGTIRPEDAPEHYDPGYFRTTAAAILPAYKRSKEFMERETQQATVAKLNADAKKSPDDPLKRQMALADYKDSLSRQRSAEERDAARAKRDEEVKRYSQVGGWKLAEGATPTEDDAKKFKAGASAARTLLNNLNEYQALVDKYGSEVGGEVAQRMDSLARDIQLSAKNEDLYGLGVLAGPDLALLEEIIQAPTGLGAKLDPFTGSRAANKARQFREMLNTRVSAKAKTYGFEPQEEWKRLAEGGQKKRDGEGFGPKAHATEPTPQDVEALHWLKRNPDDPDAEGVRARLQRRGLL
jgi:hypothetical protein